MNAWLDPCCQSAPDRDVSEFVISPITGLSRHITVAWVVILLYQLFYPLFGASSLWNGLKKVELVVRIGLLLLV